MNAVESRKSAPKNLDSVLLHRGYLLNCHDLKHTHASLIINNGESLFDVQSALAHANSSSSKRYTH